MRYQHKSSRQLHTCAMHGLHRHPHGGLLQFVAVLLEAVVLEAVGLDDCC